MGETAEPITKFGAHRGVYGSRMRARDVVTVVVTAITLSAGSLAACRAQVPKPEIGPNVIADEGICVPYPHPAARVDEVTARYREEDVWIDGEWAWNGRRWTWSVGHWEVPPDKAWWARPTERRLANGAMVYFPGHWYTPSLAPADAAIDLEKVITCPAPRRPDAAVTIDGVADVPQAGPDIGVDAGSVVAHDGSVPDGARDADAFLELPPWLSDAPLEIIQPPK